MSTPPPDAPTPLAELPRLWTRQQAEYPRTPEGIAAAAAVRLCASELSLSLAAAAGPHRETANSLLLDLQWHDGVSHRDSVELEAAIATALAAASAAARAAAWRTCPVTGKEHALLPKGNFPQSHWCEHCRVRRSAVEPEGSERGG